MPEPRRTLSIRIAIGIAFTWFAYRQTGAIGLIFSAPVWGLLLARPLFEVLAAANQRIKETAWSEPGIERHAFASHPLRGMHVGGCPWVVDVDLLSVLGDQPSEQSRRRADPARYAQLPDNGLWGYSEGGATALLAASRHPDAHKLRLYLERQVFFPARKKRERTTEVKRPLPP